MTDTETPKRRGRPKGSKNRPKADEVKAAPTNGDVPKKRGRRKKVIENVFDPSQLTFDQVVMTVKYAQDKIGDLSILSP